MVNLYTVLAGSEQFFLTSQSVVLYQVYERSTPGSARWLETDICRNFTEPAGSQQPSHVEAHAVQRGFPPHRCAGTAQIWAVRLEHTV